MSHIDALLEEDERAPAITKKVLASLDQWAPKALDEAAAIFLTLIRLIDGSDAGPQSERQLDEISAGIGVTREKLIELINSGNTDAPVAKARGIYLPYHAQDVGQLLFTMCGRQFRWMATDLLRGKVTSAIGYVRLQTESVALLHLLLTEPTQAGAWYATGLSGNGRAFYRSTQKKLLQFLKALDLDEAYEWGSAHALHVRIFQVLRANVIEREERSRPYLWLRDHELSSESPEAFLQTFVRVLAVQAHVLRGLRLARPDVNTQVVADVLGAFAAEVNRLASKLEERTS